MSEFSIEDSEAIIEAAARGHASIEHGVVGKVLTSLHSPGAVDASAPELAVAAHGVTGRIARRTAVAATVAVLSLAGVAAAATGAISLLDSPTPVATETLDAGVESEEEGDGQATVSDNEIESAGLADHLESADDDEMGHAAREIEGVDPSNGLNDAELELACDGSETHGHYVSLVAQDKITETEGTHGDRVSEAGGSDCGKDVEDSDGDADSEDEESEDPEASDDDDDDDDEDGRGHEKAKGEGHSQGNGGGHDRD